MFMPLPNTTRITKTNTTPFFSPIFFSATFSLPFCLLYFSLISIFLHTLLHFVFFQVSTPLGQKSFNTSKLLLHQRGESEKDQNEKQRDLDKPRENEEQQREKERGGRWSLTEDWIRAEQMKGRYCIREYFFIFRCFFVFHFEGS